MTWVFRHFLEIDSTNLEACRRVESGLDVTGEVVYADIQTKGVGRRGRSWQSPRGNLFATLIIEKPKELSQITFVFGLALLDALRDLADSAQLLQLKWPNDLLLNDGKLAGVLPEVIDNHLIIGFGINLVVAPQTDQPVATLGVPCNPREVLESILTRFNRYRSLWQTQGFAPIRKIWLENVKGLGKTVTAYLADGSIKSGIFKDIDDQGALILSVNDNDELIPTADIFFGS